MKKIQLASGKMIEVKHHSLSGKYVERRNSSHINGRVGVILGIRADAKSARERHAFVIKYEEWRFFLISRTNFEVL